MIKKQYLLYMLLLLFAAGVAFAFPNMQLQGVVLNASQDSSAVKNATVFIQSMKTGNNAPAEVGQTTTNTRGQFVFPLAKSDTSASYFAAVDFNGVRFYSQGKDLAKQTVVVYDTTHSVKGLSSMMHHLIVEDIGNALQIRETRVLSNSGNMALTNAAFDEKAGEYTVKYQLPDNAYDFTPMSANFSNQFVQNDGYIFDKSIILPGTHQLSYAYLVPYRNGKAIVNMGFDYHTRSFDVFLKSKNLALVSSELSDHGPFTIRNTEYQRYGIENVHAGQNVAFQIVQPSSPNRSPYPTLVLTAALLMFVLVVGHYRENGSKSK